MKYLKYNKLSYDKFPTFELKELVKNILNNYDAKNFREEIKNQPKLAVKYPKKDF